MIGRRSLIGAGLGLGAAAALPAAAQQPRPVPRTLHIGTGGVAGVFFPAGGAICRLVNAGRPQHGLRCAVEATEGSVFNLNALRAGELDLAIVQSDWQFYAWKGQGRFAGAGPFEAMRSLFSLHADALTLMTRADSGIAELSQLARRRVNLGPAGSGPRSLFEQVMERMGWKPGSFSAVTELPPEEQAAALCAGRFDAMFYAVAHPNGGVLAAAAECETTFVPVAGEAVDALAAEKSWLVKTAIPGNLYPGAAEPVPTVGVAATLVTTAGLPEAAAYQIAKSVMEDLGALTAQHPALAGLERETMVRAGLTAPLHPGAERYYREAGLL